MRTWRTVPAALATVLALAGCSGGEPSELELDVGADDAPTVDATTDADGGDGSGADGDPDDGEAAGSLGPPTIPELPPLEPDPDSDIPARTQELALEMHARLYEVTQTALHTGEFDEDELAEVMTGDLLEATIESLRERREDGVVARTSDTAISWVEVMEAAGGPITIHECRLAGPETGTYDLQTGARVDPPSREDIVAFVLEVVYEPFEVEPGRGAMLAVTNEPFRDEERCHG